MVDTGSQEEAGPGSPGKQRNLDTHSHTNERSHSPVSQGSGVAGKLWALQRQEKVVRGIPCHERKMITERDKKMLRSTGREDSKGPQLKLLPLWGHLRSQHVPEEDGVPHAEDLLVVGSEGHSPHGCRVANEHLRGVRVWTGPDFPQTPSSLPGPWDTPGSGAWPVPSSPTP